MDALATPILGIFFKVSFGNGEVFDDISFSEVSISDLEMLTEDSCSIVNSEKIVNPSGYKYTDLKLTRGLTSKTSLIFKWLDIQVANQKILPITIFVQVLDVNENPILLWTFTEAYPISYNTSGIDANSNKVMMESINFKFSSLSFTQDPFQSPNQKKQSEPNINYKGRKRENINPSEPKIIKGREREHIKGTPLKIDVKGKKSTRVNRETSKRKGEEIERKELNIKFNKVDSSRVNRDKSERKSDWENPKKKP
jgi:phage tail-like protein